MARFGPIYKIERKLRGRYRRPLKASTANSGELLARLKQISHPNIMRLYDFDDSSAYVEFIDGLVLSNRSPHCPKHHKKCWIDNNPNVDLSPLVDAVRTLHANGICHTDITSHNIMVQHDGTLKLIDLLYCLPARAEFINRDFSMLEAVGEEIGCPVDISPKVEQWMEGVEVELSKL